MKSWVVQRMSSELVKKLDAEWHKWDDSTNNN